MKVGKAPLPKRGTKPVEIQQRVKQPKAPGVKLSAPMPKLPRVGRRKV